MTVPTTSNAVRPSESRFALETYYDILDYVDCKHELAKLAYTALALQRPAETRLYQTVALRGEQDLRAFRDLLVSPKSSRIASFVRRFSYEDMDRTGGAHWHETTRSDLAWMSISDVLGKLYALNELCIQMEGAARWRASQQLCSLQSGNLTVLHCSADLSEPFVAFLRRQNRIQELHVECTVHERILPSSLLAAFNPVDGDMPPDTPQSPFTSRRRILPNLRALRTNSHTLALALLPNRPVSHVWVTEPSNFISNPATIPRRSSTLRPPLTGHPREAQDPQQVISPESDTTTRETYWCDLFHEFATVLPFQTTCEAGTRSVRLDFEDISQAMAEGVLKDFAKCLGPTIRTLGFLNHATVEEVIFLNFDGEVCMLTSDYLQLSCWSDKDNVDMFSQLHTIVLAYTPSLAEVERLASSAALPALRTVACYGFSRSFEYLCIPVKDAGRAPMVAKPEIGGRPIPHDLSGWSHQTGDIEWATDLKGNTRATPVHDPNYRLWLDA